jgi:hypothetical protein
MVTVVSLALTVTVFLATSWRRLPVSGRLWLLGAGLNYLVFFGMPTTPATSLWRPIVGRALAVSAVTSFALFVVGMILRHTHPEQGRMWSSWTGPLVIGALPAVFYAFFWAIGPLY